MTSRIEQKEKYENDKRYHTNGDNFDQSKSNRYSLRNKFGLYFELRRIQELTLMLNSNNIPLKDKKILDAGSHHGTYANYFAILKKDSKDIHGIDFIHQFVNTAKKINSSITYSQSDLYEELQFKDNYFDFVICNYLFNCFPQKDHEMIAQKILKKLKPNGHIFFFEFLDSPIIKIMNKYFFNEKDNRKFNKKKIKEVFKGTEIIDSKKMINILTHRQLHLKLPHWFVSMTDSFIPNEFVMYLLEKK